MDAVLKLDELMLEVGVGLVPLVDAQKGGQLLSRVKSMRKSLAQQLDFSSRQSTSPTTLLYGARVRDLPAWDRDRPLGTAPGQSARDQLQCHAPMCLASTLVNQPLTCRQSGSLLRHKARRLQPDMR